MIIKCQIHGDVEALFVKPSKLLCPECADASGENTALLANFDLEKDALLDIHQAVGNRLNETLNNKTEYLKLKTACEKANLDILDTYFQVMLSVWNGVKGK
jgi:hypothetical protein